MEIRRIEQITFTRFIAALTVVFFHYGANVYPLNTYPLNKLLLIGPISVSYFFALSGFIMALVYYRPHTVYFDKVSYWIARFARIFPVYILALLLVVPFKFGSKHNEMVAIFLNIFCLQSWLPPYPTTFNYPGWSLSVEAFFYIAFPFLIRVVSKRSFKSITYLTVLFWVLSQIIHVIIINNFYNGYPSKSHDIIHHLPFLHLNTFILGVVVGIWFVRYYQQNNTNQLKNFVILAASFALIVLSLVYRKGHYFGVKVMLTNGLLAPLFLLFILSLSRDNTVISRILRNRWAVLLGEASFSLYILQFPIYMFYNRFIRMRIATYTNEINFLIYVIFLIVVSVVTFKLIESPSRIFIKDLYNKHGRKYFAQEREVKL